MNFVFRKKDVFLPKLYSFYLYQELVSMHSRLQLYILFLLFLSPSLAARASIDFIDAVNIGDDVPIYAHTYFHWEKDHRLKIDEVISSLENGKDRDSSEGEFWHSFDTHQARPFAQTPMWAFFRVRNSSAKSVSLLVQTKYTISSEVQYYLSSTHSELQLFTVGSGHPYSTRPIANRNFLIPLEMPPQSETTVFLRSNQSPGVTVRMSSVISPAKLQFIGSKAVLLDGIYIGAIALLGLIVLLLRIRVADGSLVFYALNSFGMVVAWLCAKGYGYELIWGEWPWFGERAFYLALLLFPVAQSLFANSFLDLNKNLYRLYQFNIFIAIITGVVILIVLFTPIEFAFKLTHYTFVAYFPVLIVNLMSALKLFVNSDVRAGHYVLAWGVYFAMLIKSLYMISISSIDVDFSPVFNSYLIVAAVLFFAILGRLNNLRKDRERALAESKAKSDFLAKMSHEIRTPMGGVLGMTELLTDTDLDQTQRDYLNIIQRSGENLLRVINEILDHSKIAAGKMQLDNIDFDIHKLAQDCVSLFSGNTREKGVELICRVDPNLVRVWHGDEKRIRQILINLLGNAFKFTDSGEISINIEYNDNRQALEFSVRDTGIGIKEEDFERLFEEFNQADESTSRHYGGTGLGLTISKQLAQLMGGSIEVKSHLGIGSEFKLSLPLEEGVQSVQIAEIDQIVYGLAGISILLVEDNMTYQKVVYEFMVKLGAIIETANDGQIALEKIKTQERLGNYFDLISVDLDMPVMDGMSLVKNLHEQGYTEYSKVIILSSTSSLPQREQCRQWGVELAAQKPALAARIDSIFARALGLHIEPQRKIKGLGNNFEAPVNEQIILVAEDNDVTYQVVSIMLGKNGYDVKRAKNGLEVLEQYKRHNINSHRRSFALILMDCEMPTMDGFTATSALRKIEEELSLRRVPVVAITAHVVEEYRVQCADSGMDDIITKPFTMKKLNDVIDQLIL